MAQFRSREIESGVDLPVQDDAAAHAGTQRDHHRVAAALGGAGHCLRLGGGVGIVLDVHLDAAQKGTQLLAHGIHIEGKIVGVLNDAAVAVGGAGGGHAGKFNVCLIQPHFSHKLQAQGGNVRRDLVCFPLCAGGNTFFFNDAVIRIHDTYGDVGSAQIDADRIHSATILAVCCMGSLYPVFPPVSTGRYYFLPIPRNNRPQGIFIKN